jgi:hypothetical protein
LISIRGEDLLVAPGNGGDRAADLQPIPGLARGQCWRFGGRGVRDGPCHSCQSVGLAWVGGSHSRQRRRSPAHVLTGLSLVAGAVIAVAVMLMPVLVFVLVLLVVVFVLALLVLMFVGAQKGTSENVRDSHFVLPSFFAWELFPAAARRTTSQFDVSLGTFCHDPQGGGDKCGTPGTSAIYRHPHQCMISACWLRLCPRQLDRS